MQADWPVIFTIEYLCPNTFFVTLLTSDTCYLPSNRESASTWIVWNLEPWDQRYFCAVTRISIGLVVRRHSPNRDRWAREQQLSDGSSVDGEQWPDQKPDVSRDKIVHPRPENKSQGWMTLEVVQASAVIAPRW